MADLKDMTALDFLHDERERDRGGKALGALGLLTFVDAGVTDLDVIYGAPPNAFGEVSELVKAVGKVDPPLAAVDLDKIGLVGAKVYAEDRDNVADWLAIAKRWLRDRAQFGSYHVTRREPRDLIEPFLDAGRGPTYVRRVVDSAVQHHTDPHAYGFDLSADDWDRLASAHVEDRAALAGYEAAGCTLAQAVDLSAKGVAPGVAVVLHSQDVPMASWVERGAHIPADWVPYGTDSSSSLREQRERNRDPIADGVLGKGQSHTIDDLKAYADAGWRLNHYRFSKDGVSFGHGRRSRDHLTLTPSLCHRLIAAGLDPDDLGRWAEAVTVSSAGSRTDRDWVPSLSGEHRWSPGLIDGVLRLHEAGVRSSHINDYRYAGCRSFTDVLNCVAAGINGKRVAYLRKTYAVTKNSWDKPRMTLRELLDAHETDKQRKAAS